MIDEEQQQHEESFDYPWIIIMNYPCPIHSFLSGI
jgi:hypothetical protein